MFSRLLLVSVVGVLGCSLPEGVDWGVVSGWARSATATVMSSDHRESVRFEPIEVDDGSINRLADELNRRSEGLNLQMEVAVTVAPGADRATADRDRAVESLFAANEVWNESGDEVERLFADNRVWTDPEARSTAPTREDRPDFDPIAVANETPSLADELNRAAEGLDIHPASIAVASRRPHFEPIPVADSPSSLVDSLNRDSEGLAADRQEAPQVSTALRLTRDAALAWMNVLTKDIPVSTTSH